MRCLALPITGDSNTATVLMESLTMIHLQSGCIWLQETNPSWCPSGENFTYTELDVWGRRL
jgi:hypothetical protein